MRKKIHKRWQTGFGRGSIIIGFIMAILAYIMYAYVHNDFFHQSYEELLGFGIIAIIAGIIFTFFGKKINI